MFSEMTTKEVAAEWQRHIFPGIRSDHLRLKSFSLSRASWYIPVIPALRRLKEEDHEFEPGLHCKTYL
jgi:hypothetical protein